VFIEDAWAAKLPTKSADEQELVEETESYKPANSRLSCQVKVTDAMDGMNVTVAPEE
jgi:2Fe-2S ferredoxin